MPLISCNQPQFAFMAGRFFLQRKMTMRTQFPILFCVYNDNLLQRLSRSGVGCYLGTNFAGTLAYADDIVLACPTPSPMRKLLLICDAFATEYDIKFNDQKSKLLVVSSHNCRKQTKSQTTHCSFSIGGNPIERVESFSHLGHIITSSLSDNEDVRFRRNCFIGQINNICFFSKLSCSARTQLFQAYCITADMDVNYGHYMTTVLTILMLHGERQ